MKRVYLISYCIKSSKFESVFHFNGIYDGNLIRKIVVKSEQEIQKSQVYLLDLRVENIVQDKMHAELLKLKKINFLF